MSPDLNTYDYGFKRKKEGCSNSELRAELIERFKLTENLSSIIPNAHS